MKDFCVNNLPMESITLYDLRATFAEMDERLQRVQSSEEVKAILGEIYYRLRNRVLEDYITKEMGNKSDADKLDEIPEKVDTTKSSYAPESSLTSSLPITTIPRPAEVPQEFRASCVDGEILPGEIIYLNLDGHWRPYRVMVKENDATRLLGLFSIGEINKKALRYSDNPSSRYCDAWYGNIVERGLNIENRLKPSKIGTMASYIHIPDWEELQADCEAIDGDLVPAWYNDDDLSNILVYTGRTNMMSILCGEDGELHEFPYGEVANDCVDCFPAEVHPSFTLHLDSFPYYYNPVCRADLAEFS